MPSESKASFPFNECGKCGKLVVNLGGHRCSDINQSKNTYPSREKRQQRAAKDDRCDGDLVAILRSNDSYAYHEITDEEIICHSCDTNRTISTISRSEAKRRGLQPCGNCERWM